MGFKEDVEKILKDAVDQHNGNRMAAAEALGVNHVTLWGWLAKTRKPSIESIAPVMDKLKVKVTLPSDDPTREVVFVNPRIHESFNGLPAPARYHLKLY